MTTVNCDLCGSIKDTDKMGVTQPSNRADGEPGLWSATPLILDQWWPAIPQPIGYVAYRHCLCGYMSHCEHVHRFARTAEACARRLNRLAASERASAPRE